MRHLFAAILAFALAASAGADRIEFRAVADGKRLVGASVCFFPAAKDDPFLLKFLTSNDVRCLDADSLIEIPQGYWNVFAVHAGGYVSTHPYFLAKGADGVDDRYAATDLTMDRAALLDLRSLASSLGPSEWIAVYLTNDSHPNSPASIRPVIDGATEVIVPAGMTIVPLVVRSARIVRFGTPLRLSPGERVIARSFERAASVVTLVVAEDETANATGAPEISLWAGEQRIEPLLRMAPYPQFSRGLQFFLNVPAGEARLRLGGSGWIPDEIVVSVRPAATTQAPRALTTAAAATLRIAWSVTSAATLDQLRAPRECGQGASFDPGTIRIARCIGQDCKPAVEIPIDATSGHGETEVATLRPGSHRVEFTYASSRVRETVNVSTAGPSRVELPLELRAITGRVTRGGVPIAVRVAFTTGGGVSGDDGRYVAVIGRPLSTGTAYITPCDGSARYTHRNATPPPLAGDYDIDLPDNEIIITVRDRATNEPLPRARIVARLFSGDEELENLPAGATDATGRATLEDVSARDPLEICASTAEHHVACVPRFLAGQGRKEVELALARKTVRRGQVAGGSSRFAYLHWISLRGEIRERTIVRPDGAFTFDHDPEPGEMLVYYAIDHALTVMPVPPWSSGSHLRIDLPRAEMRSFEVSVSERSAAPRVQFTIAVGSFVLPPQTFSEYQQMRAGDTRVQRGASIPVRDIASTAPLSIVYAETLSVPYATVLALPRIRVTAPRAEIP